MFALAGAVSRASSAAASPDLRHVHHGERAAAEARAVLVRDARRERHRDRRVDRVAALAEDLAPGLGGGTDRSHHHAVRAPGGTGGGGFGELAPRTHRRRAQRGTAGGGAHQGDRIPHNSGARVLAFAPVRCQHDVGPVRLFTDRHETYARFIRAVRYPQGLRAFFANDPALRAGLRVLDAGCGTGAVSFALLGALERARAPARRRCTRST